MQSILVMRLLSPTQVCVAFKDYSPLKQGICLDDFDDCRSLIAKQCRLPTKYIYTFNKLAVEVTAAVLPGISGVLLSHHQSCHVLSILYISSSYSREGPGQLGFVQEPQPNRPGLVRFHFNTPWTTQIFHLFKIMRLVISNLCHKAITGADCCFYNMY